MVSMWTPVCCDSAPMESDPSRLFVIGCIAETACSYSRYRMHDTGMASNGRAYMAETRQLAAPPTRIDAAVVRAQKLVAAGGILAAIAASSCCVVPLLLFSLGVSGAWIGNLTRLAPYQPIFVAMTLAVSAMATGWFGARAGQPALNTRPA